MAGVVKQASKLRVHGSAVESWRTGVQTVVVYWIGYGPCEAARQYADSGCLYVLGVGLWLLWRVAPHWRASAHAGMS